MPYDDDDLDSVLFGGSDSPGGGVFDPFEQGDGTDGEQDDGSDGIDYDPEQSDSSVGVVRYGRFGGKDPGGFEPNDAGPLPWERGTDQPTSGGDQQRDLERTDTGIRNVRRVAESRSESPTTGSAGGFARKQNSPTVANSIGDAQQRIRADAAVPLSDDELGPAIRALDNGVKSRKITRHYEKQAITQPPTFRSTNFEATLTGLKANTTGDWIVMLRIPQQYREQATSLGDAYGLALDVVVVKHNFNPND